MRGCQTRCSQRPVLMRSDGVIASGSSDGTIALSGVGDGNLVMRLPLGSDAAAVSLPAVNALAFSSGSRYLCSASSSSVTIWDLKKHEKTRRLAGHSAGSTVLALDFGSGDQHIASASNRGEVIVHNLATGGIGCRFHAGAALTAEGAVALRDLQHSPHKKHMLGLCGDAGVVELWDCNTTSSIVTLRPPQVQSGASIMPLSALRFSPTSEALFASVGLDRRLCFYDANSRKCIRDIPTDYPLTALDYHKDGVTLVVGTSAGHLLLYDIRNASKPSAKILNAHQGRNVNAVKFGHAGIAIPTQVQSAAAAAAPPKASAGAAPARASSSSSSSVFDAKSSTHIDMNPSGVSVAPARHARAAAPADDHNATVPPALNHTTQSGGFNAQNRTVPMSFGAHAGAGGAGGGAGDLFSPIKGDPSSTVLHSPFGTAGGPGFKQPSHLHQQHQHHPQHHGFVSPVSSSAQGHSGTMLFSPIAGSGNGLSSAGFAAASPMAASAAPPAHLTSNFNPGAASASRPGSKAQPAKRGGGTAAAEAGADAFSQFDAAAAQRASAAGAAAFGSSPAASAAASVAASPRSRAAQPLLMPSPKRGGAGFGTPASPSDASSAEAAAFAAAAGGGGGGGVNEYQVALLRSMLDDSLYSLRSEMRSQISELHVEMLKQFHQAQLDQSRALEGLMARFEKAVEEVRELREDYKQLKHIY